VKSATPSTGSARGSFTPTSPSGPSWTGADTASTISSGANLVGTFANLFAGTAQKDERNSRRQLEIARLQAQGGAGAAAAQIRIAELQNEAAREASVGVAKAQGKMVQMVMIGVGALAVLGIGAAVILRK
jgi:hypothetical protein